MATKYYSIFFVILIINSAHILIQEKSSNMHSKVKSD